MFSLILITYLIILGVDVTIGLLKYNILDRPLKVMFWMLFFCLVSEIVSSFLYNKIHTKAPVYHFFSIVELTTLAYYFLFIVKSNPPKWILIFIPAISIFLGLGNLILFQPLKIYNTNMLLMESVLISGMALYALFIIMKRDEILDLISYPHFRISIALLILWTATFFFWAFLSYLKKSNPDYYRIVALGQSSLNIATYSFIGYAYYKYKTPLKLAAS